LFGAGAAGPSGLRLGRAWAQDGAQLDASTKDAMVRMARLLFPHNAIADDVYADVLDAALTSTAADASFEQTLRQAEAALDRQSAAPFVELDEDSQLAALRAVEREAFFGAIHVAVRSRFYNHPAVWEHLGYGGPSFAQGGYLNRGAGEVDWLAEAE
jgi:hypothetical protein